MTHKEAGGERVLLVHLQLHNAETTSDPLEFRALAQAAGAIVVASVVCPRATIDAKYLIGSGKVEELAALIAEQEIELALFDYVLSPSQERNLESAFKCRVLDRTGLILDIFAQRARTHEGKLQVELAQLKHHSTRLVRGWTHLGRQKGGIGLRGPGETQLEVDRRLIRERIKHITANLEKVRKQRKQGRRARKRADLPSISLVGYTNAGKSTLFNRLTGADVYVANKLFATLDPTLRALEIPLIGKVILADTVGFVTNLPHDLVEAFSATLEEVCDADLLLHVIDAHAEYRQEQAEQVRAVLKQIGALEVPCIEVYNKIDLVPGLESHSELDNIGLVRRVYLSAIEASGIDLLKEAISKQLGIDILHGYCRLAPTESKARALLYEAGTVMNETIDDMGFSKLELKIPRLKWLYLCQENPVLQENWQVIYE